MSEQATRQHEHHFQEYTVCSECGQTEAAIWGCHHCNEVSLGKRCWWCLRVRPVQSASSGEAERLAAICRRVADKMIGRGPKDEERDGLRDAAALLRQQAQEVERQAEALAHEQDEKVTVVDASLAHARWVRKQLLGDAVDDGHPPTAEIAATLRLRAEQAEATLARVRDLRQRDHVFGHRCVDADDLAAALRGVEEPK